MPKRANVIRVTISTVKARKIMNTVLGPFAVREASVSQRLRGNP